MGGGDEAVGEDVFASGFAGANLNVEGLWGWGGEPEDEDAVVCAWC